MLFRSDKSEVQFLLKGFDRDWSAKRNTNFKDYTNIPAGHYVLMVIYQGTDNSTVEFSPFKIVVLPRWHLSAPALIFYFIMFLLIVWAIYEQLDLRFARKQYMLEKIINNRTEDLIIEKEKTEKLLANVLPKNTASEIMEKGKATKIKYNFVTVLFSDKIGRAHV